MGRFSIKKENREEYRGHNAYLQITLLGLLMHLSQVVIYTLLRCPIVAWYNAVSVLFYGAMLAGIYFKLYRIIVSCIHIEVCLFSVIGTMACGWELGLGLYILAISSLVYFCPYEHKYVPYLFSLAEFVVFVALRFYMQSNAPYYQHISVESQRLIYFYSTVCCFAIILLAALMSNITASVTSQRLRDENESLAAQANYDFLTGLLSRRAFLQRLDQHTKEDQFVIAIGDLDDFKEVNDTYGHGAGDVVLRKVSTLMSRHCSLRTLPCRWGGEEFVFLFRGSSLEQARAELENLREAIAAEPCIYRGAVIRVSMTFGLCHGAAGAPVNPVIEAADALMYQGKAQGKNCVRV